MKKSLITLSILILGYILIPNTYHFFKLKNTTESEILKNRKLYNQLAISLKDNKDSVENNFYYKNLDSLYLWFHVRGLPIDEDHFEITKFEQWEEIIKFMNKN